MDNIPTISAIGLKGGSSKSTLIINLGGVLHEDGYQPLLLDLDPQQSVTAWAKQGRGKFPFPVIPLEIKDAKRFKFDVDRIVREHQSSHLLIDLPPYLGVSSAIAAMISDIALIPVTPSPLDLWASKQAVELVRQAREQRKGELPIIGLIPSRLMPRTTISKEIHKPLSQSGEPIGPSISLRVSLAEAALAGQTINNYAPKSPAHLEFKNLLKFVYLNIGK